MNTSVKWHTKRGRQRWKREDRGRGKRARTLLWANLEFLDLHDDYSRCFIFWRVATLEAKRKDMVDGALVRARRVDGMDRAETKKRVAKRRHVRLK